MNIMSFCNLASINLREYVKLSPEKQYDLVYNVLAVLDQCITHNTAVNDDDDRSLGFRNAGVGVSNLAYVIEKQGFHIDSQEASEYIDELFDGLSYNIIKASIELSKQLGPCEKQGEWHETLPCLKSYKAFPQTWQLTEYGKNYDFSKWYKLLDEIKQHGVRFSAVMAIAPTSHSGKIINATLGIEPPQQLRMLEDNTTTSISYVPGYKEIDYKLAFDCDQKMLLQQTAIMQKWVDQSISHTIFMNTNSVKELTDLHMWAFDHGIKSLYYMKQQKQTVDECIACVV